MKLKVILLLLILPYALFCAPDSRKQIFSLDLDYALTGVLNRGWGLGVYYDREIIPSLTAKGGFGHMTFLDRHGDFTCTTVSVTLALNYYPFGPAFEGIYGGITNGADFVEYLDDNEFDTEDTVISFIPHLGWKIRINDTFMVDLYTGYKFSPFTGISRRDRNEFLNMGMQYKAGLKVFL